VKSNGYNPKIINGFVLADWYTDTLKNYDYNSAADDKFYISNRDFSGENSKKIELEFKDGRVIENNIVPIETYKIGDKLSFYYSQNWIAGFRGVTIHGVIRENNGKMVRLEILSLSGKNEEILEQLKKETINDFDNFWINPRYCEKTE